MLHVLPIDLRTADAHLCDMDRLGKILFSAAVVLTLVFAWTPHPPVLIAYDNAQHGLAFAILAILGRMAFRKLPWQVLALSLAVLGAIIEIVQLIPQLHRSSDVYDWYADVAAMMLGLMLHTSVALWRSAASESGANQH